MPLRPAATKNSTNSSTLFSVVSGSLRERAAAALALGAGAISLPSAGAASASSRLLLPRRLAGRRDDRELDVLDLAIRRGQQAVLAGCDEVHADLVVVADNQAIGLPRATQTRCARRRARPSRCASVSSCAQRSHRAGHAARRTTCRAHRTREGQTQSPAGDHGASPAAAACGTPRRAAIGAREFRQTSLSRRQA